MAVLNLTPDSFSDGGRQAEIGFKTSVAGFIRDGATIIDVGGQSTRPGAPPVSEQDEIDRVVPAIEYIASNHPEITISIDTFYAKVAERAVEAGAHIINDVSGGLRDPEMLPTAARLRKTIILMHMRGDPSTMTTLTDYPEGVVKGVGKELNDRVEAAIAVGIPRWRIVLDPGIGFAKNQEQNLELLRKMSELRAYTPERMRHSTIEERQGLKDMAWLVGPSRKGFIGKITDVAKADERAFGTAIAVDAAIRGGADIVRVHDVKEMVQAAKMSDALWRYESAAPSIQEDSSTAETLYPVAEPYEALHDISSPPSVSSDSSWDFGDSSETNLDPMEISKTGVAIETTPEKLEPPKADDPKKRAPSSWGTLSETIQDHFREIKARDASDTTREAPTEETKTDSSERRAPPSWGTLSGTARRPVKNPKTRGSPDKAHESPIEQPEAFIKKRKPDTPKDRAPSSWGAFKGV